MRFLIVSDLHIPERAREIPPKIIELAKSVDCAICAGDFTSKKTCLALKNASKKLVSVKGNCDTFELPEYIELKECGHKIGVVHSNQLGRGNIDRLVEFGLSKGIDILIFGHTHKPFLDLRSGVLLINPGSANGVTSGGGHRVGKTYAILELAPGKKPIAKIEKIL